MWQFNYTISPDELYHYGVKGMKWGIRKDKYESNERFQKGYTLEKGSVIQNISVDEPRTVRKGYTPIYGAVTKNDKINYKGFYSSWLGGDKIYDKNGTRTLIEVENFGKLIDNNNPFEHLEWMKGLMTACAEDNKATIIFRTDDSSNYLSEALEPHRIGLKVNC